VKEGGSVSPIGGRLHMWWARLVLSWHAHVLRGPTARRQSLRASADVRTAARWQWTFDL